MAEGITIPEEKNQMDSLIREWDGESVIVRFDRQANAWIFVAIHSTRLGPAIGGTRMKPYPSLHAALQDALRLGAGMTYKWAAAGVEAGGGKTVIAIPDNLNPEARGKLLRDYGAFVQKHKGLFLTGPDLGTSSEDMDIIAETGAPYIFARTPEAGGAGNPGPFTALGVFTSIQVVVERLFADPTLVGKRITIQGVGSVGRELIELLLNAGAEVFFSDVDEATIAHFCDEAGLQCFFPEEVYESPCDIFAPCAVGGVLNEKTIPRLRCRAVAGAANNQLATQEDALRLRERGILYAPDFIANSGGAIAIIGMETKGWSRKQAEEEVVKTIKDNLSQVFELAETEGLDTDEAARRLAEQRLAP
ncbi:MAG: Glu/Leu/Phe/Val dehydrogenase dimerization domain-containing protein [Desulfobacteraceae bacterium]|jgi:leucine dehydrogenase